MYGSTTETTPCFSRRTSRALTRGARPGTRRWQSCRTNCARFCDGQTQPVPAFDGAELVQEQESALQLRTPIRTCCLRPNREPADGGRIRGAEGASPALRRRFSDALPLRSRRKRLLPAGAADLLRARAAHRERNVRAYQKRERLLFRGNRRRRRLRRHDLRMPAERLRGAGAARRLPRLPAREGSYGEWWSLRKVLRRFLWHDRIHAKAMYRMLRSTFADAEIPNPFCF